MSDCTATGFSGEGRCIEPAEAGGLCAAHRVMTPATVQKVPNQPRTPLKSFRIPQALYEAAQAKAAERGESVSDVVRRALERYIKRK